jgi:DNA-binding transcriptional LysR family regulator
MADIVGNMRIFVRVVEKGSFTAIAKEVDMTVGQVSRAVNALEEQLQAVLLHRTTRHLSLTDSGGRFYERAKAILADFDAAAEDVRTASQSPAGRLRLHCAPGLAQSLVAAALARYLAVCPDVQVELKIEQSMPNLVEDGYDLSLFSATELPDSIYVAQPLGTAYSIMVASPGYLKRNGVPRTRDDLASHTLIEFDSPVAPPDEWHLESDQESHLLNIPKSPLQTNAPDAMRAAIIAGAGIGALATYSVADYLESGALVRVLPQYRLRPFTVFAVYPSRRFLDAKVRTILDHLRETLSHSLKDVITRVEALERTDGEGVSLPHSI